VVVRVGFLDVVAGEREARELADARLVALGGEEDEARLGLRDAQLDPALFAVERLVGDDGEAEFLGVEIERGSGRARGCWRT